MSVFTTCFRLFHRKRADAGLQPAATFRKDELALIEALERQRRRTGRVRAVIDDPHGKYPTVLQAYLTYIQSLDKRDAIIINNHRVGAARPQLRGVKVTPRSYLKILGAPRCIGQILLLNAEKYCPSLPLCRSRLDQILQLALPYVNGPNTVVIIHGSTRTPKNTRFRHWVEQAISLRNTPAALYLPYSGAESSAQSMPRKSPRRPLIVEWRPSHGRTPSPLPPILHSSFFIYHCKIAA